MDDSCDESNPTEPKDLVQDDSVKKIMLQAGRSITLRDIRANILRAKKHGVSEVECLLRRMEVCLINSYMYICMHTSVIFRVTTGHGETENRKMKENDWD